MEKPDSESVRVHLTELQDRICAALEAEDGEARFVEDAWQRAEGGGGRTRVLCEGALIEKAGVSFSHVLGSRLPPSATARNAALEGGRFEAIGVSLIVHPKSPYVPAAHANVRFLIARKRDQPLVWWFGGGFDLTPCYGFVDDAVHWHRTAKAACDPFGPEVYPAFKKQCDDYFTLAHRGEARGIGGLFFDDLADGGFERCFALMRSVGDHFLPAYLPIVRRRRKQPYGEREREFQLYRRGRYVEFNLVYDRGTAFGLQSGGRTEAILVSLPPLVRWRYDWQPEPGSEEARLTEFFLQPRDWLGEAKA